MQIFIFLRNASLYKEFFLAHVNVFFKKVSLCHYSALLSLRCSDNQHVCCSDTLPYTPCNVSSMYHDFEVKYHDFGLPIVKSMLFFSNVRTFANRFASQHSMSSQEMGNQCPQPGHSLPIVWALIAHRSGTRVNSPMVTVTLGENVLTLRVVRATLEVRRKTRCKYESDCKKTG